MKHFYRAIFAVCLLIASVSANAQGWKLSDTPTGINQIRDMVAFEGNLFISVDGVVYRSDDQGQTWEYVQIPYSQYYCFLTVQNGELFITNQSYVSRSVDGFAWDSKTITTQGIEMLDVTTDGSKLWTATLSGLYFSTDGVGWTHADQFGSEAFLSISAQGAHVFASSLWEVGKFVFTTDGGLNWSSKTLTNTFLSRIHYNDGALLANMKDAVWRSTDNGDTWTKVREAGVFFLSGSTYYHIGKSAASASSDNGLTWTEKASQIPYPGQFGAALDGKLFVGAHGGGIFTTSIADPSSWHQANGDLRLLNVTDLAYHQGSIFMSAAFRGIFVSSDEGKTWNRTGDATLQLYAYPVRLQSVGDDLFGLADNSSVIRTSDGGQSWVNLGNPAAPGVVREIGFFKDQIVVAASNGVYMTDNRGDTWTKSAGISGEIEGISMDTRRLYCSGLQGLKRYDESSQAWTPVPINGTNPYIREIVFVGDVMFVQSESGVLKSEDDGATWTTVDSEASFFDMSARHTALYRSRDGGFSQSLDSGATWEVIGDSDAPAILFAFSDKHVFARFDKRIWYRSLEEFAPPFVEADTTFSADEPLVITFDHEPYTLEGNPLTEGDLGDLIVIVDSEGNEVPFEATLSEDHLSITIVIEDPKSGESYTINVAPVQSAAGIQSKGQTITANAEVVTGIDENPNVKISVHPNPFEHHVTISFGDTDGSLKSAALFDVTGKQVSIFGANEADLSLDGAHLKPGMYVLKVSIGNRVYVRKAVKN